MIKLIIQLYPFIYLPFLVCLGRALGTSYMGLNIESWSAIYKAIYSVLLIVLMLWPQSFILSENLNFTLKAFFVIQHFFYIIVTILTVKTSSLTHFIINSNMYSLTNYSIFHILQLLATAFPFHSVSVSSSYPCCFIFHI